MTKLVSLALAAEARGRAQALLDDARRQTDRLRLELEQLARELVDDGFREIRDRSKPGEQLKLPTSIASYASRYAQHERYGRFAR